MNISDLVIGRTLLVLARVDDLPDVEWCNTGGCSRLANHDGEHDRAEGRTPPPKSRNGRTLPANAQPGHRFARAWRFG